MVLSLGELHLLPYVGESFGSIRTENLSSCTVSLILGKRPRIAYLEDPEKVAISVFSGGSSRVIASIDVGSPVDWLEVLNS